MRQIGRALAGLTACVITAGTAVAADVPQVVVPVAPPPPVAVSFDWAGLYVGADAGLMFGNAFLLDVHAGYAMQFGNFVVSLEGALGTAIGGPAVTLSAIGRAGITVGDRTWIYGLFGRTWPWGGSFDLGGGIAMAISDNASVRVEVSRFCCWSPIMIKGGVSFHLGN